MRCYACGKEMNKALLTDSDGDQYCSMRCVNDTIAGTQTMGGYIASDFVPHDFVPGCCELKIPDTTRFQEPITINLTFNITAPDPDMVKAEIQRAMTGIFRDLGSVS
jgi:hypothetical protein